MASRPPKKPRTVNTDRKGLLAQRQAAYFNPMAHEDNTNPVRLTWTSKTTLATGLQTLWYPQRSGRLVAARATLQTSGASSTIFDLLMDGYSVMDSGALIIVPSGAIRGYKRTITKKPWFQAGAKLQINITSVGAGAGGPAVVEITYFPNAI